MAQGSDPRPPAAETAAASSASMAPAIGASTIGCSIPNKSMRRRSGHMTVTSSTVSLACFCSHKRPGRPRQGEQGRCAIDWELSLAIRDALNQLYDVIIQLHSKPAPRGCAPKNGATDGYTRENDRLVRPDPAHSNRIPGRLLDRFRQHVRSARADGVVGLPFQ